MVYISGLKFRGFKSFRRAEVTFPNGYICLAGPNGSGKSNVTDGIRFALGEGSLKSLRAKKVSELINTTCKFAEVTLFIDGERKYEIKRGIMVKGSDVKTLYRINGKRSTRTLVMEELRRYGLEAGSHNIIAQGQVQKIVEMSTKERRQIIDSVAGIAEFDAKKDEALRELQKVEQKITEAQIVLSEREVFLTELEKEKNAALQFLEAQENFKRAMASIASSEYTKLSKSHAETIQKQAALAAEKEGLDKQLAVLQGRISELDSQKQQVTSKLGSSGSREAALAEIQELKVKISSDSTSLSERKKEIERISSDIKSLTSQAESLKKSKKEMSAAAAKISTDLSSITKQLSEPEGNGASSPSSLQELSRKLEFSSEKIVSLKEQKAAAESSLSNIEKMLAMKHEEKERLQSAIGQTKESRLEGEMEILRKEILAGEAAIEKLFSREREINRLFPELDKRFVQVTDRVAALRSSLLPAATSLALRTVEDIKSSGNKGIFGTVSSLMSCEPKYSTAVEAAAGARLMYVVVDRMDTAITVIEKLKAQKAGRCTFIPLDMPKSGEPPKSSGIQGCLGSLIDFIDFDAAFSQAMRYVFSDTLLFDTVQNAKKAGIGAARMVTLEGELIEKSGIITGGAQKGSLLARSSLEKAESEASSLKKERDSLYSQLYAVREEMAGKRKEKAAAEVKLKGFEIESSAAKEQLALKKKALDGLKEIDSHLQSITKELETAKKHSQSLASQLEKAISEHNELKHTHISEQEKSRKEDSESQKKLQQLHAQKSSLEAQLEAKKAELERLTGEQSEKEQLSSEATDRAVQCKKEISALESDIEKRTKLSQEKEKKLAEIGSATQKLLARLKELESQISEVADHLGKVKFDSDKRGREIVELSAKREIAETRLSDLKATLEQYSGVPTIDATKAELEELSNKSKAAMDSLGAVNLKAPELYEEKKKDIEEIKSRVTSLDTEKKAVFSMMDEIEGKKRAIFLSTFTAINDNFKRLFGYVFRGEGSMLLEQPSSPFESGLLVKVREEGGRDKYLDSMSGGEKSLLALIFIFAIQMYKAAPFYILDEADAALDKENSKKLADLLKQLANAGKTQFIVVTHNDTVLSNADVALGVTRTDDGSKIVGVQLTSATAIARPKRA
jgi:chromosome segregation protein